MKIETIPNLPGFNVETALIRLGGNQRLYLSILEKFLQQQKDAVEKIEQALIRGERQEAIRLTHTLKGLAGNIGNIRLQEASARIEADLMETSKETIFLDELKNIMSNVILELTTALPDLLPTPSFVENTNSLPRNDAALLDCLRRLEPHVQARKPRSCFPVLEELHRLQWPDSLKNSLLQMEQLIQKYHMKDAHKLLQQSFLQLDNNYKISNPQQ
ncbi:hypothetical protein CCP3SC5AM1_340012 [Gammaproteobacteria bacterium]